MPINGSRHKSAFIKDVMNMVISANVARQRLLRLSEAAEKLRRQVAISIQAGKENDVRDLLFQKKQTMQALENTKSRIELLDELSTKLFEAIYLQERKLFGTVSQYIEIEKEDAESPVQAVSPLSESLGVDVNSKNDLLNARDDQELQDRTYDIFTELKINDLEGSLQVPIQVSTGGIDNNNNLISNLTCLSSYEDFLDRIDQHLNKVEAEINTVVKFSTLVLETKERPKNLKDCYHYADKRRDGIKV